jgi:hypothetical protein
MDNGDREQEKVGRDAVDWALWEQRYAGLAEILKTLQEQVNQTEPSDDILRQGTFSGLLGKLSEYAEAQFKFVYQGPDPNSGPGPRFEPSLRYPADFVLKSTIDQVAFDLVVIQSAWYQRTLAQNNTAMKRTFEIADQLAYCALLPAIRHKLIPFEAEEVTALTYFQKAPHIRMIPYASVALIGLPFSALAEYDGNGTSDVGNAVDLLAIPHEIGHYVYQHGSSKNSRLQNALYQALQGQPEWLYNWAEEIFADVYGCLVAGPVMVRDFQDLARAADVASLLDDDSDHPMPVLRPLLYCDTLRLFAHDASGDAAVKQQLLAIAEEAEGRWDEFRGKRGDKEIAERRNLIKDAIAATLHILVGPDKLSVERLWSQPASESSGKEEYDCLYERFHEAVTTGDLFKRLGDQEEPPVSTTPPELNKDWLTPLDKLPTLRWLKQTRNSAAEARDRARRTANAEGEAKEERPELVKGKAQEERAQAAEGRHQHERIPTEVWTLVVSMNGWATDGPVNEPDPKVT